jgi:gluconokinase
MVVILMGVTASGKTTIGRKLADELRWPFYDADDFHPATNIDKMERGLPLTDADRRPWLDALRDQVQRCLADGRDAVLTSSALKEAYRQDLLIDPQVKLVYLKAAPELIRQRLRQRQGHFMNPALLDSQFATLEEPRQAVYIDAGLDAETIVRKIRQALQI